MATTNYTGTATDHTTITIPDDAEYQSAGIAAFNTPLEELKDLSEYNEGRLDALTADSNSFGTAGTTFYSVVNNSATVQLQVSGVPVSVQVACNTGDILVITVLLGCETSGHDVTLDLVVEEGLGPQVLHSVVVLDAAPLAHLTMHAVRTVANTDTVEILVKATNGDALGTTNFVGEFVISYIRIRP